MATKLDADKNLIDSRIDRASTLPARYYREKDYYESAKEKIFAKSWHLVADSDKVSVPGHVVPVEILPGYLDEPILLTRDTSDNVNCMANVCTHRGSLLVEGECHAQSMRCRYHGRRFALDGKFMSAPGFDEAKEFPRETDNLARVPFHQWEQFLFASVSPSIDFEEWIKPMKERLSWLPLKDFVFRPEMSHDYSAKANWCLYVENYLEGFHIPYVHPALATALDPKDYKTEIYKYSNLQIGVASDPADAMEIPKSSPDHGKNIAAYYYWLFPNLMMNFYPWGLSINIVVPLSVDRTKISYLTYVYDESKLTRGAGANTDRTEREDENIIELVQRGVKSRFYDRGRYSPEWEEGPHHFHTLLTQFLG